jgi:hypothetical protein
MHHVGIQEVIVLFIVAIVLRGTNPRELAVLLAEGIENFRSNFPRGPGSPSHPIPADDSRLLCRKRPKSGGD